MKREFIVCEIRFIDEFSNIEIKGIVEIAKFDYHQHAVNFIKEHHQGTPLTILEVWS